MNLGNLFCAFENEKTKKAKQIVCVCVGMVVDACFFQHGTAFAPHVFPFSMPYIKVKKKNLLII